MMNAEMMEIIEKESAFVATATPEGVPNGTHRIYQTIGCKNGHNCG